MVLILLLATLLYPLAMFKWPWNLGPLDWGPVWAGYLGCVLFSAAALAVGMMISSLTESDVIAFFATLGVLGCLYVIGYAVSVVQTDAKGWTAIVDGLGFISFQSRYQAFARGLVDTRAIVYFLSVTVLCLLVSFRSLESRKWS
jgi:ABC-2 type transport system permease protein